MRSKSSKLAQEQLTKEVLSTLLMYDDVSGKLFWRERPLNFFSDFKLGKSRCGSAWNTKYAGKEAFISTDKDGYKKGEIFAVTYFSHRVIWMMHYNEWPDCVDHIDGNPVNNRLDNLRSVPHEDNCKNQKIPINNTSGVIGVSWKSKINKWQASIRILGVDKYLGVFSDKGAAIKKRKEAEQLYKFHENHGRVSL